MIRKKHLLWLLLLMLSMNTKAQDEVLDSVEISLLTCSPHDEVYSLYGHTALRVQDKRKGGSDIAVNYGMFSFEKPFFVLRFIFGLTDYEMAIERFDWFCDYYRSCGSSVTQQTLQLTREEKARILAALDENYQPQNRVYRYNYFYDNCTTRAIDMILNHLSVSESPSERHLQSSRETTAYPSFRWMTHQCTLDYPWATFGNDMLLGLNADKPTSKREWLFLPHHAMEEFADISIAAPREHPYPLVDTTLVVVQAGPRTTTEGFPLRPRTVFLIFLIITLCVTISEFLIHKHFWGYDALLMTICGLAGIVLFLMLFSQHPTVRLNLQLLLLNPLPLFFIWRMVRRMKNRLRDRQYAMWIILICLFFIGGFWQQYAEGMYLVASSLLIRNIKCYLRQHYYPARQTKELH